MDAALRQQPGWVASGESGQTLHPASCKPLQPGVPSAQVLEESREAKLFFWCRAPLFEQ